MFSIKCLFGFHAELVEDNFIHMFSGTDDQDGYECPRCGKSFWKYKNEPMSAVKPTKFVIEEVK